MSTVGETSELDRKPCPLCGQMLTAQATQCPYCGESPVDNVAAAKAVAVNNGLTAVEWIMEIVCPPFGGIMGLMYLIKGKRQGSRLIVASLGAFVVWILISRDTFAYLRHVELEHIDAGT